jgi:hypothetical protein
MKNYQITSLALFTLVTGAFSVLSAAQEELFAAIQEARTETILTHNELVASLKTLDALINQKEGDLRPAYDSFKAGLAKTREASERTQKRVAVLRENGDRHFATWKGDIEQIQDKGIRDRAMKRLDKNQKSWNSAATALEQVSAQFPTLLGYLADVEKALSYDLNTEGVKSVRGAARNAASTFDGIQKHVGKAITDLEAMITDLSSIARS